MILDAQAILVAATLALSAAVISLAMLTVRQHRRAEREAERRENLSDGCVLRAEGGRITDLSDAARALLDAAPGARLADVLTPLLGDDPAHGLRQLARLVDLGEPMHVLVRGQAGTAHEIAGQPEGGQVRIVIRDARFTVAQLERAESALAARERSLSARWYEREAISSLIEGRAAIAWIRDPEGAIAWCAGAVATRQGAIDANQVAAAIANRRLARPEGGPPEDPTLIEILPSGGIEPVPLKSFEVETPDGRTVGLAVDGTVAASAERTLSRFVQTMTETFAHLTVGLAIFDRNQRLALFNPALARMLRIDPDWLAGKPSLRDLLDQLRSSRRLPDLGDFHGWRDGLLRLYENTEAADYEEIWQLADGSSIKVLARPHPHGSLAFVFDDVSERMRLEQDYRQSLDLRHATLSRLDEGLAVFGADGMLQLVNDAFHEIFATDAESVHPGMHAREVLRLCQGLTVETEVWRRIAGFITADEMRRAWSARLTLGSRRTLSARLAPLPGGASMIVFADITDSERIALALRERNEVLEAAEEMRTAVLDQISHRLRTPLNTIFGFGQLLSDQRFGALTESQREYADGILVASGQLLDTIDDVTELASLQLDPLHDEGADPPLAETLELTRQLLDKRASEAGVHLQCELPEEALAARCDAVKLRQIVFNLAAGAIQRSPSGGTVTLTAQRTDDGRVEIHAIEQGEAQMDLSGIGDEAESLAFSVLRRMTTSEGGRFERRRGPNSDVILSICSFEDAFAEIDEAGDPFEAGKKTGPRPAPLPFAH